MRTAEIGPDVAPAGTVARSSVEEITCVLAAAVPLKLALVNRENPAPLMVTDVPGVPLVGENPEIVKLTANDVELVAVPEGVVTAMGPEVAPFGTVAVSDVFDCTANAAGSPLNVTAVVLPRLAPLIVTEVDPAAPVVGLKPVRDGPGPGPPPLKLIRCTAPPSPRSR